MLTCYLMHRARTRNSYSLLMGAIMNALLALHLLPLLNPILPYHTLYQSFSLHSLYSHSPFVTRSDEVFQRVTCCPSPHVLYAYAEISTSINTRLHSRLPISPGLPTPLHISPYWVPQGSPRYLHASYITPLLSILTRLGGRHCRPPIRMQSSLTTSTRGIRRSSTTPNQNLVLSPI